MRNQDFPSLITVRVNTKTLRKVKCFVKEYVVEKTGSVVRTL